VAPIFLTAGDGTRLACWDFASSGAGTDRQPLLMVHGTGLNARSWAPVAGILAGAGFRPLALDMRGHGSSGRSPDGQYPWPLFGHDVLAVVDQLGLQTSAEGATGAGGASGGGGVVGVGHSAGASALLLAEAARPGTFSRLWAWEPIMRTPTNDLRQGRGPELAQQARRRRAHFASVEEGRSHFEGRGMFAEFSAAALDAFSSGAFVADEAGGVRLACLPEDEARMYEGGGAHDAWEQLAHVRCPVRVVGGERSPAVPPDELARIAGRLPAGEMAVMAGLGHFGPFQDPALVAAEIQRWVHISVGGAG
jgi:pimeloyl-ACP methyl ester carboxylesterase